MQPSLNIRTVLILAIAFIVGGIGVIKGMTTLPTWVDAVSTILVFIEGIVQTSKGVRAYKLRRAMHRV